jgi:hypothetical protein
MRLRLSRALSALALLAALGANAQGKVHGEITATPPGGKPHEIAFDRPDDGVARAQWKSAPFFAVILKSAKACAFTEEERKSIQAMFPGAKVFMTRFQCDGNVEENVTYTNVDPKAAFIAVYAGDTLAAADRTLAKAKATGKFRAANLRRLQAVVVYP